MNKKEWAVFKVRTMIESLNFTQTLRLKAKDRLEGTPVSLEVLGYEQDGMILVGVYFAFIRKCEMTDDKAFLWPQGDKQFVQFAGVNSCFIEEELDSPRFGSLVWERCMACLEVLNDSPKKKEVVP